MMSRNAAVNWNPDGDRQRPLRRVVVEQRGLGDLARSLLGHAASRLGERRRSDGNRRDRKLRASSPSVSVRHLATTSIRTSRSSTRTRGRRRAATGTMRRVPEVIDTWFDSGSMPFAQWHYPFENTDTVAAQYPADFIAEGVDQTRGWFYSLLAIATGLGDALPNNGGGRGAVSQAVVVNDLVLDAQGTEDVQEQGQRGRSVGGARAARRRCGAPVPRGVEPGLDAAALRRGCHSRDGRTLPAHVPQRVQRHLRAVRKLRMGTERRGSRRSPIVRRSIAGCCRGSRAWRRRSMRSLMHTTRRLLRGGSCSSSTRTCRSGTCGCRARDSTTSTGEDNRAAFATLHEVLSVTCAPACAFRAVLHRLRCTARSPARQCISRRYVREHACDG